MKIRQQVARPCEKKGLDNHLFSKACECLASCIQSKGYLKIESIGTINYKNEAQSLFNGCHDVDKYLISQNLIRYESREKGGLEVLFEGIEAIQNLNGEIFNYDYLDGVDYLNPVGIAHFYCDPLENQLVDLTENDRGQPKGRFTDEGLINYFPQTLGFAQSSANTLSSSAPENLQESFFHSLYARGEFDHESEDFQNLATCLIHGIEAPKDMKKIWPRYTDARYQKLKAVVWMTVHKKMPGWARRFDKIWSKLSEAQAEALSLEWFYENEEKPTQEENALKLGISIPSYKERLNWAYKKLQELYPEFDLISRRLPAVEEEVQPKPLFMILSDDNRVEIPIPVKRDKVLTPRQKGKILKWAKQSTTDYLLWLDIYDQVEE